MWRRFLHILQGSSGARAKIWSNFRTGQAYFLQHSYFKAPVVLEPKFGQIIQLDKPNTTTAQLLQGSCGARTKIWSNFTNRQAYLLQYRYSKAPVELEPKFGQIIQDKPNTTAQPLPDFSRARESKFGQIIHKTSLLTTAQPLPHFSRAREPTFGQIIHKTKPVCYKTATPRIQRAREQKFGQIIQQDKTTYYSTASPTLL